MDDLLCERSDACEEAVVDRPRFSIGSSDSVTSFSTNWTSSKMVETRLAVRRGELEFPSRAVVMSFGLTISLNRSFLSCSLCVCVFGNRGVGSSESDEC